MQHTALIVDDDNHSLLFLEQALRPLSVNILKAEDGVRAIELLEEFTPSVVFLDILLPKVDGLQVLGFMQETPRLNAAYVVIVSAHNHFDAPELERADVYFVKPLRVKDIRDAAQYGISRQIAG